MRTGTFMCWLFGHKFVDYSCGRSYSSCLYHIQQQRLDKIKAEAQSQLKKELVNLLGKEKYDIQELRSITIEDVIKIINGLYTPKEKV